MTGGFGNANLLVAAVLLTGAAVLVLIVWGLWVLL